MEFIKGGITTPQGFLANAVSCGIKKSGKDDLALLFSKVPAVCEGAFTINRFRSGSVLLSEQRVKKGKAQAVIVNSGNANCCVGKREIADASFITDLTSQKLGIEKERVLIASTGIIGKPLPLQKLIDMIPILVAGLHRDSGHMFSRAIMTTDTVSKEVAVCLKIGGKEIIIGGTAKGSGMIYPHMATMLVFFTTDASIEGSALDVAFKYSVFDSFNRITVDGDMSTNDTAIIFANGLAGNRIIKKGSSDYLNFLSALKLVAIELAKKIVLDGEGATRFVEVLVKGGRTLEDSDKVARRIANSLLIKTMLAGGDPNWGRIAVAIGASGAKINKEKVDIYFGKKLVMKNGSEIGVKRELLSDIMNQKEIHIIIDLKSGDKSMKIWTCDLTGRYVEINAEYEA